MSDKPTMTLLSACTKGGMATVCKINATGPLKQRLVSFGLMRGVDLVMLECSPTKSTFEVKVGTLNIALRKEEAALIEVCNVR
jgi:ferrous iron transport protein A